MRAGGGAVMNLAGGMPENGSRVQEWLYPLTEGPEGTSFGQDAGRCSGRFADYCRAVTSNRISRGEGPLQAAFRSMGVGDVLWLYAGRDVGIVGRGTVRKLRGRPEPRVTFGLDRTASRLLAQDPMPGSVVRRWLSGPMDRPLPLAEHAELTERLASWIEDLEEDDRRRLEPLGVASLRQALRRNPSLLEDPPFGAFTRMLRARGMAIGVPGSPSGVSVVACDDQALVVARIVEASKTAGRRVLESVGLLGWYGRSLALDRSNEASTPTIWHVFGNPPPADLVAFLEDVGNFVGWSENDSLALGPLTKPRWECASRMPVVGAGPRTAPTPRPPMNLDTRHGSDTEQQPSVLRGTWAATLQRACVESQVQRNVEPGASESTAHPAMFDEASPRMREAFMRARTLATSRHHATMATAHVMIALMDDPGEDLAQVLHLLNVTPGHLQGVFEEYLAGLPMGSAGTVLGSDVKDSLRGARLEAHGARRLNACHFFLGALRADGIAAHQLGQCGIYLVSARATFGASWRINRLRHHANDGDRVGQQLRRHSYRNKLAQGQL